MWSFNMACEIEPVIREKHPQIQTYASANLFNDLFQAATIISSMLRIERRLGPDDYAAFHKDVVQNIAPSVRNRYMPAMQALLYFLLGIDRGAFSADEIPAFGRLLSEDETKVANSIGHLRKLQFPETMNMILLAFVPIRFSENRVSGGAL